MHHTVVVNARAGTALEAGPDAFAARIVAAFEASGCTAEVRLVNPPEGFTAAGVPLSLHGVARGAAAGRIRGLC